jgi:hypothetical protein
MGPGTNTMSETTSNAARDGAKSPHHSQSQRHRVLADRRRRVLLAELEGHTEPVSVDALTSAIVARERGDGGQSASEKVRISLHHIHLPLLNDHGIVDYDTEDKVVERRRTAIDGIAD